MSILRHCGRCSATRNSARVRENRMHRRLNAREILSACSYTNVGSAMTSTVAGPS